MECNLTCFTGQGVLPLAGSNMEHRVGERTVYGLCLLSQVKGDFTYELSSQFTALPLPLL